jgi:hypothetical protein
MSVFDDRDYVRFSSDYSRTVALKVDINYITVLGQKF